MGKDDAALARDATEDETGWWAISNWELAADSFNVNLQPAALDLIGPPGLAAEEPAEVFQSRGQNLIHDKPG